jgi:3-oxoacyl-[acyl-carrier protein] reductase
MNFFNLNDKVALVTGASRGIGAAIAKRLAKAGATVVINFKSNQKQAEDVLKEVQRDSPKSMISGFDISDASAVDSAIDAIHSQLGGLHIAVCNAGLARDALLPRSSPEHFDEVIRTNLLGTINVVRSVSRLMMKNRYGRIICMGSVVGEMGNKGQSAYAASKSALFGFSKSVAKELASRNVTCNVVCPGFIETEMTGELSDQVKAAYLQNIPLSRFGTPEEVAACVHYLASEEASYISGTKIDINGGLLMQ